jgi:hypothetical protein
LVAVHAVSHRAPFFAPIAAVVCHGLTRGQGPRRPIELTLGVGLGVGVGDLLISAIGARPWQIALIVALAMSPAGWTAEPSSSFKLRSWAFLMATLYVPGARSHPRSARS